MGGGAPKRVQHIGRKGPPGSHHQGKGRENTAPTVSCSPRKGFRTESKKKATQVSQNFYRERRCDGGETEANVEKTKPARILQSKASSSWDNRSPSFREGKEEKLKIEGEERTQKFRVAVLLKDAA